jgi:hypothetical protein
MRCLIVLFMSLTAMGCTATRESEDHNQHWFWCVGACVSLKDDKNDGETKVELGEEEVEHEISIDSPDT